MDVPEIPAMSWNGSEQFKGMGLKVTLDGSSDASVEVANGAGATAYVGRIELAAITRNAADVIWMRTECASVSADPGMPWVLKGWYHRNR